MKSKLILSILVVGAFLFQMNAMAESLQGTISSIDTVGRNRLDIIPEGNADPGTTVKVLTAPGVKFIGVDAFEGLQIGDWVRIQSASKSKTGEVEATRIEKKQNIVSAVVSPSDVAPDVQTVTTTTTVTTPGVSETVTTPVQTQAVTTPDGTTTKIRTQETTTTY